MTVAGLTPCVAMCRHVSRDWCHVLPCVAGLMRSGGFLNTWAISHNITHFSIIVFMCECDYYLEFLSTKMFEEWEKKKEWWCTCWKDVMAWWIDVLQCVRDVGLSVACDSSIHESFLNNYIHDVNVIIILNFSRPRCLKNEKRRKNACTCVERMSWCVEEWNECGVVERIWKNYDRNV